MCRASTCMCTVSGNPFLWGREQRAFSLCIYGLGYIVCSLSFVRRIWVPAIIVFPFYSVQNNQSFRPIYVFRSLPNAPQLQNLISFIESVGRSAVLTANSRRPKRWRQISPHAPARLEMGRDFVEHSPWPYKLFITESRFTWELKHLTQPSFLKPESALSRPPSDGLHEVFVYNYSNIHNRLSFRRSCVMTEENQDSFLEAP